ncbi:hypothetical protein [Granulicella rosea]|nr:hypothetical protein [Granulicella rosea]
MSHWKVFRSMSVRVGVAAFAAVLCSGVVLAQTPPKKAPPAKPAAKPAAPAAKPAAPAAAAHPGAASTSTTHSATTTTTTGAHGATTTTTTHTTTTTASPAARGGFGGGAARPGATPVGGRPGAPGRPGAMGRPGPAGSREMHGPGGDVRMRPGGRPMDVHDARRGMDIHHNLGGGRRVFINRPGGGHMYYERGRPGYIGHPYMAHGYEFNRRTYYYNGRAYDRFYRPYGYHGYALEVYAPVRYYPVGFYGWAYHPWAAPAVYGGWGFAAAPWYGVYGGYFQPYPVYASPSLWLTDYMISQTLAASYAAAQANAAQNAAYAGPPLSPEVKQMVADEVQREIALENAEAAQNAAQQAPDPASSGIARIFSDGAPHVFVAGREVDVVDANGAECAITDGDVVQTTMPPGPQDTTANVVVLSSKGGQDCRRSANVAIGLDELQEMSNHMRETVDQGMQELQAKQGQGGLPQAPASALATPSTALVAMDAPPPDPNGQKELEQQAQQSEGAEKEVLAGATSDGSAPMAEAAAPVATTDVSIAPGQSTDDVKGALGAPTRIVNLGTKTMYFYKDMKVTFVNGKVTNIE